MTLIAAGILTTLGVLKLCFGPMIGNWRSDRWRAERVWSDPMAIALAKAIGRGDLKKIDKLVGEGADVNARGNEGISPLMYAWSYARKDAFGKLLELGADPNREITRHDNSVVFLAAKAPGDSDWLQMVLRHGGDPNVCPVEGHDPPIFGALSSRRKDNLELLISAGADLNHRDKRGRTAMMYAATHNWFNTVYYLLDAGADYRIKDNLGFDLAYRVINSHVDRRSELARWRVKVLDWLETRNASFRDAEQKLAGRRGEAETLARWAEEKRQRAERKKLELGGEARTPPAKGVEGLPKTVTNTLGMELTLVPAGEFLMGSDASAAELERALGKLPPLFARYEQDTRPEHMVRISKSFYLGIYEVRIGDFAQFVDASGYKTEQERSGAENWGWDPIKKKYVSRPEYNWRHLPVDPPPDHPVADISWNDAVAFCAWLSAKEGCVYRLPSEAEWEYACRAGTTTTYYNGDDPDDLTKIGNVADATIVPGRRAWQGGVKSSDGFFFACAVGRFQPNAFGLYDMIGNVQEFVADKFAKSGGYPTLPADDPMQSENGPFRVVRGGSWDCAAFGCRCANRLFMEQSYWSSRIGFRVLREP